MIRIAGIAALLGLVLGLITGWQAHDWMTSAQALRQQTKTIRATEKEESRREGIAESHATVTEAIEAERENQDADLQKYLDHRPDVRSLDLGPEWLCLADRAAGIAEPRCPDQPQTGVPQTTSPARQQRASDAASVSASTEAVPNLRRPPEEAGAGDRPTEAIRSPQ